MCSQKIEQELLSSQTWPFWVLTGTALHERLFSADYSCDGHPWVMVALPACSLSAASWGVWHQDHALMQVGSMYSQCMYSQYSFCSAQPVFGLV